MSEVPLGECPKPESGSKTTLAQYLKTPTCKVFKPVPIYLLAGDMLIAYFEDAPAHTETVTDSDNRIEVERANDDGRIVGVKLYGIKDLVLKALEAARLAGLDESGRPCTPAAAAAP